MYLINTRIFQRWKVSRPVIYLGSTGLGVEKIIKAETFNISQGGLCIGTEASPDLGEIIRLKVEVDSTDIPIPNFAEVRWTKAANGIFEVGLEFLVSKPGS